MPPVFAPRAFEETAVCLVTRLMPSTRSLFSVGNATRTLPVLPRSLPVMTTTSSPFLIFMLIHPRSSRGRSSPAALRSSLVPRCDPHASEHLRCQRDDLHELLVAQLAADWAEDTCAAGFPVGLDEHGCVLIELDVGAVGTPALLHGADD